jgi:ABC-type antimicrobial peptide transport system permease subunit
MTSLVDRSAAPYRLAAALGIVLALASIVLALVGVYAVTAASVTDRTREIGVRAALGASPRDVVRMILREGAAIAASGTVAGLAGAVLASRLLHSQLFGVHLTDVTLLIPIASATVLLVGVAATLPAAFRASRLDPLRAMRTE